MAPDRTHIHHILMRAGFSGKQTLYVMVLIQSVFVAVGVAMMKWGVPDLLSFILAIAFVGVYQLIMKRSWRFIRWNKRRMTIQPV